MSSTVFAQRIIHWQRQHGRHALPWQTPRDPYRVWVSEIMLQQTQVSTVAPYFERFMAAFPDVSTLAGANEDSVLAHWAGLGYYARAHNLHRAAQAIAHHPGGRFPDNAADLAKLPGIGRSTAAAIAAICFNERAAILDGNVRRVLCRHQLIDTPADAARERQLWALAESLLPEACDMPAYTQGLMDMGATLCTRRRPACDACPLGSDCIAKQHGCSEALPRPAERRQRPIRHGQWLLIESEAHVLLRKNPSRGLWGGLHTLPEAPDGWDAWLTACGWPKAQPAEALPPFQHDFTHFRLQVTPWRLHLLHRPPPPPQHRWLARGALTGVALPAPVKQLLERH